MALFSRGSPHAAAENAGRIAEHASHGGALATAVSAIALIFSGISYYESSMKTAELEVYVPPMIHYARDGDNDVFNIPITIVNDGARSGTILGMELLVENPKPNAEEKKKTFHSIFIGEYPRDEHTVSRSFAPLAIPGHGTFTETVRFYPAGNPLPFVVDDKGDYNFTLKILTAKSPNPDFMEKLTQREPRPLSFSLNLPYLAVQHLTFRHGTLAMYNKDWQAAVSTNTESAASKRMAAPTESAPEREADTPKAPDAKPEAPKAPEAKPQPAPPQKK